MTILIRLSLLLCFLLPANGFATGTCTESPSGTHTSGSTAISDVQDCITDAATGEIVVIPNGSATWGVSAAYLDVDKDITVQGSGSTVITLSETTGQYTSCAIRISAGGVVKSLTVNGSATRNDCALSANTVDGWRITDIAYNGGANSAYFVYVGGTYGLIDNNTVSGGNGSNELLYMRGPTDSWTTDNTIGGAGNIFIENNTFDDDGYVTDMNANSRVVVRYNTITFKHKIDAHGIASNTPVRSARHYEIYNNNWTTAETGGWRIVDIRGGTGRVFGNVVDNAVGFVIIQDECYASSNYTNCKAGPECLCPSDYPVDGQIGVGKDPKVAGSEPLYMWDNLRNDVQWAVTYVSTANCTADCGEAFDLETVIIEDTDFFNDVSKPAAMSGYTPYTCPHPDTGLTGTCDEDIAGVEGYNVEAEHSDNGGVTYDTGNGGPRYGSGNGGIRR